MLELLHRAAIAPVGWSIVFRPGPPPAPAAVARLTVAVAIGIVAAAVHLPGSAASAGAPIERVVTLGDSYSSGQGIHADASDYDQHGPPAHSFSSSTRLGASACHRELDTTPGARLAAELGASSSMVACAGADADDIENQLDAARIEGNGAGTLLAITIGGNDVRTERGERWPDVLFDCIFSFRCHRDGGNRIANLDDVEADLTSVFTAIGDRYPGAVVRVLGYPRLMQRERWGCPGVTGVGRSEADWIDDRVDDLNGAIEGAADAARLATGADIGFVSVVDEFDNHGACRFWQRDRYVNDRVTGQTYSRRLGDDGVVVDRYTDTVVTVSGASFHPSQKGYDAYGRALAASI